VLKDLFYINNELSLSRVFMFVLFLIGSIGCVLVYFGAIPSDQGIIDMIKWILSLVVGNKVADNVVTQMFGSARGTMPIKNPRGDVDKTSCA